MMEEDPLMNILARMMARAAGHRRGDVGEEVASRKEEAVNY